MNKSKLSPISRFWRLLKPDQKEIQRIYLYSILIGLINLTLPLGIQSIVNLVQAGKYTTSWMLLVILVVFGVFIIGVMQIFQLQITENLQQKIFARAAFEFAHRIPRMRMEELYRKYAPELINRFFDVVIIQKSLSKILLDFVAAALQMVFCMILLSLYHSFFIFISFVIAALMILFIRFTVKKGLETSIEESGYKYKLAYWLQEIARSSTTFKMAGQTNLPLKRTEKQVDNYLQARQAHFKVLLKQYGMMVVIKTLIAASLLGIGGVLVINQNMNLGQFIAAEIIILLLISAVEKLIMSMETIYDVLTSLEKLGTITDINLDENTGLDIQTKVQNNGLQVMLNDISFTYPNAVEPTLLGVNLQINSNEKWLIEGENNAGKSTLMYLIAGLYQVQKGNISYAGLPMANLDKTKLYNCIGDGITQEQIFPGTFYENISMGRNNIDFEYVHQVCEQIGLSNYINGLPKGYETEIGNTAKNLPQNVAVKLLIARAVADKPKLLLLEDILGILPIKQQQQIIDFITLPDQPWTLVCISNQSYMKQKMDVIVTLEKGSIKKIERRTK